MRITKRHLRRIIKEEYNKILNERRILLENEEHSEKLAALLMSNELESVVQAVELGETLGYLEVVVQQEKKRDFFFPFGSVAYKIRPVPSLMDAMIEQETKNYNPERIVQFDKKKGFVVLFAAKPKTPEEQERLDMLNRVHPSQLRENISSMLGSMQWTTWKTFEDVYNGLNDKFRYDMDECLREDMIGEEWIDSIELLDEIYEGEDLEDKLYELASEKNWHWEVESFRKYKQLHTPDRIMTALWFIANKKPLISNFAYSIRDSEEIYDIAEQCKAVVDMYGLAPSFKDMLDSEAREAAGDHRVDKEVGVVRMTSFME